MTATPNPFIDSSSHSHGHTRMHKRRRLASAAGNSSSSDPNVGDDDEQEAQNPTGFHLADNAYRQHQQSHSVPANNLTANDAASPYPNVSSFQQPYFHQQTDPSIYNSPWPPALGTVATYAALPAYSTTQHGDMVDSTLFPVSTSSGLSLDMVQGLDSFDNNFQDAFADLAMAGELQPSITADNQVIGTHAQHQQRQNSTYLEDAGMHLKTQSLPILDNLAVQVIQTVAKANYQSIQQLIQGMDTEEGQAYSTLKNLFEQTRKVYSRDTPFIDAVAIHMFQPRQQETIRRANIATFVSSLLGAHDVSFFQLNEYFLETFVSLGHRLLKWQGAMLLELKTQAYISALINSQGSREAILDELFPGDLDAQILSRHPDAVSLSPSEQDFVDRSRARKSYLLAEPQTEVSIRDLSKKYQWADFVREFASCMSKNADSILNIPQRSQTGHSSKAQGHSRAASHSHPGNAHSRPYSVQNSADRLTPALGDSVSNTGYEALLTSVKPGPYEPPSSSTKKGLANSATVRQPWTKAEEDALLSGLGKVKGPHWSQILALYGRGGSVSEVLKDRNQVQLKDKARNLKLWHLKMGTEVPAALQGVTGELRKRGGAKARAAATVHDNEDEPGS